MDACAVETNQPIAHIIAIKMHTCKPIITPHLKNPSLDSPQAPVRKMLTQLSKKDNES